MPRYYESIKGFIHWFDQTTSHQLVAKAPVFKASGHISYSNYCYYSKNWPLVVWLSVCHKSLMSLDAEKPQESWVAHTSVILVFLKKHEKKIWKNTGNSWPAKLEHTVGKWRGDPVSKRSWRWGMAHEFGCLHHGIHVPELTHMNMVSQMQQTHTHTQERGGQRQGQKNEWRMNWDLKMSKMSIKCEYDHCRQGMDKSTEKVSMCRSWMRVVRVSWQYKATSIFCKQKSEVI